MSTPLPPDNRATAQHPGGSPVAKRESGAEGACNTPRNTAQRSLAAEPRILDRFARDLRSAGLVGEERGAKLLYLVLTSRLLERPISAVVKAPSAAGKSYLVDTVLRFFPESAFYTVTGMSERALVYSEEPLAHRTIVIYEAAGVSNDGFAPYFLRTLLSEGHIRYETVETPKQGKPKGVVLEREGPTGAVLTTTRVKLDPELETRLLSIPVSDSPGQTKAVMRALAEQREGSVDGEWHVLQRLLADDVAADGCGVTIPFARHLAEAVPPVATRLRRDFGALLGLIRAHALLHRATREIDREGRTIASAEDYAVVRDLVADLVSEGVGRTVSPPTRETVEAVARLEADHEDGVTVTTLAGELKLDKSATSRRVRKARDDGYLRNLEDRRGRPARLRLGDPLPDEIEILPDPGVLHATVAPVATAEPEESGSNKPDSGGVARLHAEPGGPPGDNGRDEPGIQFELADVETIIFYCEGCGGYVPADFDEESFAEEVAEGIAEPTEQYRHVYATCLKCGQRPDQPCSCSRPELGDPEHVDGWCSRCARIVPSRPGSR